MGCVPVGVPALPPCSALWALVSLGPELLGTRDRAQSLQEQLLAMSPFASAQTFHGIVPRVLAQGWGLCPAWKCPGREGGQDGLQELLG